MEIWVKSKTHSEGKYLVVRRDGTVPAWPHFVLGGDDRAAPAALLAYADRAAELGYALDYVMSIRDLAKEWADRPINPKADPDAAPHRKDMPVVIAMMRRGGLDIREIWGAITALLSPEV